MDTTTNIDVKQQEARVYFLAALNSLESETNLLGCLRDAVFPFYSPDPNLPCRHLSGEDLREMLDKAELEPFSLALAKWANDVDILERWIVDAALAVLDTVYQAVSDKEHPASPESLVWMFLVPRTEIIPYAPPDWPHVDKSFGFVMLPYSGKNRADYKRRTTAYFKKALNKYLDNMDRLYSGTGAEGVLEVRQPAHYEWLARHRVMGWDWERIAESHDSTGEVLQLDTIRRSVKNLATRLEI